VRTVLPGGTTTAWPGATVARCGGGSTITVCGGGGLGLQAASMSGAATAAVASMKVRMALSSLVAKNNRLRPDSVL
jgi:D-arabinose 1-dehydrogenase-like Zn-dependent alcohol dehydrogenase